MPTATAAPCIAPAAAPPTAPARALCTTSVTTSAARLTTPFAAGRRLDVVVFFPPDDLAVAVRFDAVEVFRLLEVFGETFFSGDFAPLVVLRVFAAVDFDPPLARPPVVFVEDDDVLFLADEDPPPLAFLEDDPPPVVFLEDELPPAVFLEDDPPVDVFFEVDRAPVVDLRDVELPPDFAPPDRPPDFAPPDFAPPDFAPPDFAPPDFAPLDVVFFADADLALEDVPFLADDPVEPDAFFAVVFLAGDFFAVDAVFDFDPELEVDFDEVDFLAEVFDEVFFVVAIGPPVIKVLK